MEEYQKIDIRILKAVQSLSSTEENDVYSGIIIDQLRNFGKLKAAKWNQTTLMNCIIMNVKVQKNYKFLQRLQILNLPCPTTLSAYIKKSFLEVEFTSLVEKRIIEEVKKPDEVDMLETIAAKKMTIKPMIKSMKQEKPRTIFCKN